MTPALSRVPRRHIAVVIAAMDEAANVEQVYERLSRALLALPDTRFEFIWVVEGADGTVDILRRLASTEPAPPLTIIEPAKRRGLGAAFRQGFAAVPEAADIVVTMDADLNHQPEELERLLDAFEAEGADIAIGSRKVPGGEIHSMDTWRRWAMDSVNWLLRRLFRSPVQDVSSGYRVYCASALRRIHFANDGYAFQWEIVLRALRDHMRVIEVPITFVQRREGQSKLYLVETGRSYLRLLANHLCHGDRP
jgi:dolichol-phosphate mannosyltransferase